MTESAEYDTAAGMDEEGAMDALEAENEEALAPENESLYAAQEAPETFTESSENAEKVAVPLYVTNATFEALKNLLIDEGADFCLDEGLMIFSVTKDNQEYLAEFADEYALGISPLPGETYEIWLQ